MKIDKTIEENHEAKLMVEIDPELMDKYRRRAARKISERGKIAGFRPGKAPYDMVVRTYGEQSIIEQAVVRCSHRDHPEELVRKGKDLEANALSRAVRAHLEDRVLVYAGKTVVFE